MNGSHGAKKQAIVDAYMQLQLAKQLNSEEHAYCPSHRHRSSRFYSLPLGFTHTRRDGKQTNKFLGLLIESDYVYYAQVGCCKYTCTTMILP